MNFHNSTAGPAHAASKEKGPPWQGNPKSLRQKRDLSSLLNNLRWLIPALMALLGIGYTWSDYWLVNRGLITLLYTLSEMFVIGIFGPILAWLLLNWAASIARARQRTEEMLERRALQLGIASLVSQRVTAILEKDALLAQIVQLIRDKFGYYHVHLLLVDSESDEIVLSQCSGQADESLKLRGVRLKIGGESITGWVAKTGQPILCNNIGQEPRYYSHELLPETQAELAIPLRIGDRVIGVLDVQSNQCDSFREDDLTTLQILGDQIAIAIQNAHLFQETRQQFEVMRALHDISLDITSHLESQQVLTLILEQAARLLSAQSSALGLFDPQAEVVRIIAIHNVPADVERLELRLGEGVIGQIVATGRPLIVNDYYLWAKRSRQFQESHLNAIVGVPLRWHGQIIGALNVIDQSERRPFAEDDIGLLSLFADLASIVLKKSELYAQVVQLNQHLEEKVDQRTQELVAAQEALAQKADQLQRLLAATVRIQEEERTRIARDLHDDSNQLITGTLYEIQAAQESIRTHRNGSALEKLETAKELLRTIEAENRRIISGLRPSILDAQGLVPTLKWFAEPLQERYQIDCSIRVLGQPVRLRSEIETTIYRVVQESLNNVIAHAQARHVQVRICFRPKRLELMIEDDGVGFDDKSVLAASSEQVGLIGMRERVQSIGGSIQVRSSPAHGTQVVVTIPLADESALGHSWGRPEVGHLSSLDQGGSR